MLIIKTGDGDHDILPQFEGKKTDECQYNGDNPKTDDDLTFCPAFFFKVMVDRRHQEHAFFCYFEIYVTFVTEILLTLFHHILYYIIILSIHNYCCITTYYALL